MSSPGISPSSAESDSPLSPFKFKRNPFASQTDQQHEEFEENLDCIIEADGSRCFPEKNKMLSDLDYADEVFDEGIPPVNCKMEVILRKIAALPEKKLISYLFQFEKKRRDAKQKKEAQSSENVQSEPQEPPAALWKRKGVQEDEKQKEALEEKKQATHEEIADSRNSLMKSQKVDDNKKKSDPKKKMGIKRMDTVKPQDTPNSPLLPSQFGSSSGQKESILKSQLFKRQNPQKDLNEDKKKVHFSDKKLVVSYNPEYPIFTRKKEKRP